MLNESGENEHSYLVPNFRGKTFSDLGCMVLCAAESVASRQMIALSNGYEKKQA